MFVFRECLFCSSPQARPAFLFASFLKNKKDGLLDWREIQTLVRSMSDFRKTLILANVVKKKTNSKGGGGDDDDVIIVEELAMTTEHAPFRHKPKLGEVGSQRKRQKISPSSPPTTNDNTTTTTTASTSAAT